MGGCILLCLVFVGCLLITKTFTIVVYLDAEIESDEENIDGEEVNLENNDIWIDHKDEINSIESVEFAAKVWNMTNNVATGQVWVSDVANLSTLSELENNATLVLDGFELQPGENVIEREESAQYIRNFEELKAQVESGGFWAYGSAQQIPFHLVFKDSMAVIVSFTAGN